MLNENLVKWIKRGAVAFCLIFVLAIGYTFGGAGSSSAKKADNKDNSHPKVTKDLTQQQVEDFLLVYFTKKDLEENRNRYKPFMTETAYNQEVALEEEATNQAYKGYVVNQKFKDATIYLDEKNLVALVEVSYTNDLLKTKNSEEGALKNQASKATLKLKYLKQDNKMLVSSISSVVITDSANPSGFDE